MTGDARELVRGWLGEDAHELDALSDADVVELHGALVAARRHQGRALAAATDEALRQMPAVLRGTVRRIVEH
ncbi:hypothetical protein [Actinophytocola xanthii]|uniref:Uncharacterized protein n=1 Tax=Actinophytocola xanthii TaxID=1912961 RepID=A0A1Q8C1J7_9PSEU|nr:hypothetical protein [Actinophytocola xanthii]OLF08234.1 hypothetical protein BU204_34730 [Actinophytocola xanthii]